MLDADGVYECFLRFEYLNAVYVAETRIPLKLHNDEHMCFDVA